MGCLKVLRCGPACSLQDMGRPGLLEAGLSQGGAADIAALMEGAALLGQSASLAALEMGSYGGVFEADGAVTIALTGAPMTATCDGQPLIWNAVHQLKTGQRLDIGAARSGVYGYLHLGGGIEAPKQLGARSAHFAAGLGQLVAAGDSLAAGADAGGGVAMSLSVQDRFTGGEIRLIESFQSAMFSTEVRRRFAETVFIRGGRANRMGVELLSEGAGFAASDQLNILSEIIVPGDVQMTGDGQPFVLLRESQTTGGYPRIGTVLPCDLPKVAQAPAGASLSFRWVSLEEALAAEARSQSELAALPQACQPLIRDIATMQDLLSYQLISGVVSADADPFADEED